MAPVLDARPPIQSIASGRFELAERLGAGCFGEVWRASDRVTGHAVAVKLERPQPSGVHFLDKEAEILRKLAEGSLTQRSGFSRCFHFGSEEGLHCLVMDLFGKSLEEQLHDCGGSLRVSTVALLAEQMIDRIEYLHARGFVHRDIKPDNWMIGAGSCANKVYLIDFGLAKRYIYKGDHAPVKMNQPMTGTVRYSSINSHRGLEMSRRDDLEAIGHMLAYFLRGSLPWSGLHAKTDQDKIRKIGNVKLDLPLAVLFAGFPPAFQSYVRAARRLQYSERPNYASMRKLFQDVRETCACDSFEWTDHMSISSRAAPLEAFHSRIQQPDDLQPGHKHRWLALCHKSRRPAEEPSATRQLPSMML